MNAAERRRAPLTPIERTQLNEARQSLRLSPSTVRALHLPSHGLARSLINFYENRDNP